MRIRSLHIENFGKLHDFRMELEDGLNVVCADNGWGKSTLAAFIKAMFYGLDYTTKRSLKENERKKYMPWQGGAFGGSMVFLAEDREYRVERFFGVRDKEDTFVLYDLDTGLESQDYTERLGEELFHLDRAAFERSSFFAQQDSAVTVNDSLNAGLTHVKEDAGDIQNYEKAAASLEERMKFYQKTGGRGKISKLEEERKEILRDLNECRSREAAAAQWKEKTVQKEQQEKELSERIRELEARVKSVQVYGEKAAKREQYVFLKHQAESREAQLQRTAAALGEYASAPPDEEELDRCREAIYRIHTLQMQEKGEEDRVRQAQKRLEELAGEREAVPEKSFMGWLLAGACVVVGAVLLLLKLYVPGVIFLAAGIGAVFPVVKREQHRRKEAEVCQEAFRTGEAELQSAEDGYGTVREKRRKLEAQVKEFLHAPEETEAKELELFWKLERQKSQEYRMLRQDCENQRREAARSREAYRVFRGKLTDQDAAELKALQKPQWELAELQRELEGCRGQKERLLKEQRDLQNQLRILEADAERIPELETDAERIAEELADAVREHGLLEKTLKYLKSAKEQFSTRYLKELQQGVSDYLRQLEPKQEVESVLDVKLKAKIREAGAARDLEYFSAGWQDLVQIAKRFAVVDALYEKEQPVLILDDPFVNLDEGKLEQAKRLLEEMGKKRQMIYFTCRNNG
ncbi:MAG: AAA family ATPase [Clostridiales bacterium]|nr:AAA family ATPase [Clostridiales bacterium]